MKKQIRYAVISAGLSCIGLSCAISCSSEVTDQREGAARQPDAGGTTSRDAGSGGTGGSRGGGANDGRAGNERDAVSKDTGPTGVDASSEYDAPASEGGLPCLQSVADSCAQEPGISCHWPTDVTAFCTRPRPFPRPTSMTICDEYRAVLYRYVDISGSDYYDPKTGNLIARVAHYYVGNRVRCNVGPPHFVVPNKCTNGRNYDCSDGGTDAGGGADARMDQ